VVERRARERRESSVAAVSMTPGPQCITNRTIAVFTNHLSVHARMSDVGEERLRRLDRKSTRFDLASVSEFVSGSAVVGRARPESASPTSVSATKATYTVKYAEANRHRYAFSRLFFAPLACFLPSRVSVARSIETSLGGPIQGRRNARQEEHFQARGPR
jgi:hypothetical protein